MSVGIKVQRSRRSSDGVFLKKKKNYTKTSTSTIVRCTVLVLRTENVSSGGWGGGWEIGRKNLFERERDGFSRLNPAC